MKKLAGSALLIASLGCFGCLMRLGSTTSTIPLATYSQRPQLDPDQVKIYLNEQDVPGTYEKIALIYVEEGFFAQSVGRMVRRIKESAAKVGANGVILGKLGKRLFFSDANEGLVDISEKKLINAVAIYIAR